MLRALFYSILLLLGSSAAVASTPFRDAFFAYTKVRELEDRQKLLPYLRLDPLQLEEAQQKVGAELTAARIDFHSVARVDGKELSTWEAEVLARVTKKKSPPTQLDQAGLDFLVSFARAKSFSLTEWKVIADWFGKPTEQAFLKSTFAAHALPTGVSAPPPGSTILWVRTFSVEAKSKREAEKELAELRAEVAQAGHKLEILDITPFAKADDQATELVQAISLRQSQPVLLFSQGLASAVVYRALDIYPGFRKSPAVRGWVNWDGQLYGQAPSEGRNLASVAVDPIAAAAAETRAEAHRVYGENMRQMPPLVPGFPIYNLISTNVARAPGHLRESVVAEGSTWLVPAGPMKNSLPQAFSLANQQPAHGLRDAVSDFGF